MKKVILEMSFLVAMVTVILGTTYVSIQQVFRQSANDPQIQIAEDTLEKLSTGKYSPADFMAPDRSQIDISKSLSPFISIFDDKGVLLESTAKLPDGIIALPIGVFDFAKSSGENIFTWQPKKSVRYAVVLKYYDGEQSGFVMVGRSLREIENRDNKVFALLVFGWVVSVIIIFCFVFWYNYEK